jgi:CBS domain-containing protein
VLDNTADIDRLASSAIRVEHFATHRIVDAPLDALVSEVRAWMDVNDFDVVPILSNEQPMVVLRAELAKVGDDQPLAASASPVIEEQIVSSSTPLPIALDALRAHGWLLVYDNNDVTGIVTQSDLGRPAISIYIFARMISLEHGLRRLLGSHSSNPITDEPPNDPDSAGPKYLKDVLKEVRKIPELVERLGFSSKTAFDRGTNFLVELRNHIAHGRSILAQAEDAQDAVQRIKKLETLVSKISNLLREREQVWRAFEATNVIQKVHADIVWAGPGATPLPLPTPIHIITAYNPFEKVLNREENQQRQEALERLLNLRSVQFTSVCGVSPDGQWVEPSFAVHGLNRSAACALARYIGQRAIFELDDEFLYVIESDENVRGKRHRAL